MDDFEFIKSFSKIQVSKILKKLKIDKSNFYNKRVSEEKIKLVRKELEKELNKLKEKEG